MEVSIFGRSLKTKFVFSCFLRIATRVGEKKIKADSARVQETERDTRKSREAERETAITNATDGIAAAVAAPRDPSTTAE